MVDSRNNNRMRSRSSSPALRTQNSFKHRFAFEDEDEAAVQHRSPKRRGNKSFVLFNPFDAGRKDAGALYGVQSHDHYRRQRSVTPELPVMQDLKDKYSGLQIAMHSKIISKLEAAEEELTKEAVSDIKANQLFLAQLSAAHSNIIAPVLKARTKKIMVSPGGSEVQELIDMGVAVTEFQKRVDAAESAVEKLWSDWEAAHAEVETIGRELEPADINGTNNTPILTTELEHDAALAELNEDIDALVEKHTEEYKTYEKEFLKKIDSEAGKIVQSYY